MMIIINSEKYFKYNKQPILLIVDYAKAFDTIDQQKKLLALVELTTDILKSSNHTRFHEKISRFIITLHQQLRHTTKFNFALKFINLVVSSHIHFVS